MLNSNYTLPDSDLISSTDTSRWSVWVPDSVYIVLGNSNTTEDSIFMDRVKRDSIKIVKRPSGGQAVVLTPDTPVVSVSEKKNSDTLNCMGYFKKFSRNLIEVLQPFISSKLSVKGTSDIASGDVKISGSSIYQNRTHVFYHAVINVAENPALFSEYLKHPPKEPEYREKREHSDFVTSMQAINPAVTVDKVVEKLKEYFHGCYD